MKFTYQTMGTCCSKIDLEINNDVVTDVKFYGGCNGNLQLIPILVDGLTVEEIEKKCQGIKCGYRNTSCGDQLAKAVREAYKKSQEK